MNTSEAREAIYTALVAAIPAGTPVIWDNRDTFDLNNDQRMHIRTEFIVHASEQKSLGQLKVVRRQGVLALMVCVKEGTGTAQAIDLAVVLCSALQMKSFSGLQTKAASPERSAKVKGWHLQPVSVPFWFDELVDQPE